MMTPSRLGLLLLFLLVQSSPSMAFCPSNPSMTMTTMTTTTELDYKYGQREDETARKAAAARVKNNPTTRTQESHQTVLVVKGANILERRLDGFVVIQPTKELPRQHKAIHQYDLATQLHQRVASWNSPGYRPDMVTNLKQEYVRDSRNGPFEGDKAFKAKIENVIQTFMTNKNKPHPPAATP